MISIGILYPFFWMLTSAFKSQTEIFTNPWGLPTNMSFENFIQAWRQGKFSRVLINSLLVTSGSVLLAYVCSVPGAYFFLMGKFKGKVLYYPIVISLVIPIVCLIIPLSSFTSFLGIIDTYWALIFPYAALHMPLCMFLLREFFSKIPNTLREASLIDGASEFQVLRYIIVPISKPASFSAASLMFIMIWNEFTLGLVLVTNPRFFTIPLGLNAFTGAYSYQYPLVFAALVIVNIPLITILCFLQRHFTKGILGGALKE